MLRQSIDPFIGRKDMITYLIRRLLLESSMCLRFDDLLEEARVDCADDIDQELSRGLFRVNEVIMKVALDLIIILDLLDQIIHLELTIERQSNLSNLIILETCLFTPN